MAISAQIANKSTLNLVLGVFLKLLGFFVVLYTYADASPIKARQAEESIRQRFHVSISLQKEQDGDASVENAQVMQQDGRAYTKITEALKTEIDFLSTRYLAYSKTMSLTVPAGVVVPMAEGQRATSPDFASILSETLKVQKAPHMAYMLEVVIHGNEEKYMMEQVSLFIQKMIAEKYPEKLLSIGYSYSEEEPVIELRIKQVAA